MLRRWQRRLRYWLHSGERARLLREEKELHLELKARELMEDGMPESQAYQRARREFGNPTLQQEDARSTWVARWLNDLLQDVTFATRTIRKQPGFATLAILSAALGIGACFVIFVMANAALFRQLPVGQPSRLMAVSGKTIVRRNVESPSLFALWATVGGTEKALQLMLLSPKLAATALQRAE